MSTTTVTKAVKTAPPLDLLSQIIPGVSSAQVIGAVAKSPMLLDMIGPAIGIQRSTIESVQSIINDAGQTFDDEDVAAQHVIAKVVKLVQANKRTLTTPDAETILHVSCKCCGYINKADLKIV